MKIPGSSHLLNFNVLERGREGDEAGTVGMLPRQSVTSYPLYFS